MNARLLAAFLAASLATGCVYVDNDGTDPTPTRSGDITFHWSFAGKGCSAYSDLSSAAGGYVKVSIPGETLAGGGEYPCRGGSSDGVVLHDFAPGSYGYKLEAFDVDDVLLYSATGTVRVDGDVAAAVDLAPVTSPPAAYGWLSWRFPSTSSSANPTCAQVGVATVWVRIDGGAWRAFDCAAGQSQDGVTTPWLTHGSHTVDLEAQDASGYTLYGASSTLRAENGAPMANEYALSWTVGGAAVSWTLFSGTTQKTCAEAGLDTLYVNFRDSAGQLVYDGWGDAQPCTGEPVVYNYLQAGTYKVELVGTSSGGAVYRSSSASPRTVTVTAGAFITTREQATARAVDVEVYRQ